MRNELKQIISASGGFGLLQIVSEPEMRQCASEDAGTQKDWRGE